MDKIEVQILNHNLEHNFPLFLAMLTQRGHKITKMFDLQMLYTKQGVKPPDPALLNLPHTTIMRMNYVIVAITGLSTKAVSQLRTHAKRCTCISTSTQYSEYSGREDNYVIPPGFNEFEQEVLKQGYEKINDVYKCLIDRGWDKDKVGYLLPQGLRKAFIMCANIDDWRYILRTRLCKRNTEEVQHICKLIYQAICNIRPEWLVGCLPQCAYGKCPEGKFCCGKPIKKEDWESDTESSRPNNAP